MREAKGLEGILNCCRENRLQTQTYIPKQKTELRFEATNLQVATYQWVCAIFFKMIESHRGAGRGWLA